MAETTASDLIDGCNMYGSPPWMGWNLSGMYQSVVGNLSDNFPGGWYAYRSSKTALNMIIRNAALETRHRSKEAIVVGIHHGTVDSKLSAPFQRSVPEGTLHSQSYAVGCILEVLGKLRPADSGKCFAWDGKEIVSVMRLEEPESLAPAACNGSPLCMLQVQMHMPGVWMPVVEGTAVYPAGSCRGLLWW